jgi:hypothetical protein
MKSRPRKSSATKLTQFTGDCPTTRKTVGPIGRAPPFETSLLSCHTERRQFDRGMHNPVSVRQSPHSDMFADSRPCEILPIPVERCYPHIGELEKLPRERKKTLEDRLLCGKHECAEFAGSHATRNVNHSERCDCPQQDRDCRGTRRLEEE